MKKILLLTLIANTILTTRCTKHNEIAPTGDIKPGLVKGRVVDTKGNGIGNAKVVIENTVFHAVYVYATTNAEGYFRTNVPEGSWHASVQIQRHFLDRLYNFELHPDTDDYFSGSTGAVRNFSWKLSGVKPGGKGFYGSNVAVYSEPGSVFSMEDVELALQPQGPLVDGSAGVTIIKKLTDIGGGEDGILDVPIGMYAITARNTVTGQPFQIRIRNMGTYGNSVTAIFNTGFTGLSTYQIAIQIQ